MTTNPSLTISTRIKLRNGSEAVISDNNINQPFRMIDVGRAKLLKIQLSEIDSFYSLGNGWIKCEWH